VRKDHKTEPGTFVLQDRISQPTKPKSFGRVPDNAQRDQLDNGAFHGQQQESRVWQGLPFLALPPPWEAPWPSLAASGPFVKALLLPRRVH